MKGLFQIKNKPVIAFTAAVLMLLTSCGVPLQPAESAAAPSGAGASSSPVSSPSPSPSPSPAPSPAPSEDVIKVPIEWDDGGIFSDYYDEAFALLATMTLEEKVGQMILARCPQQSAAEFIKAYKPGGLVLFEVDFRGKTTDGVIAMIGSFQDASKIPMIISTDEEGGAVIRLSRNTNLIDHLFRSPQKLYSSGGFEAIRADTLIKASLFLKLGLNLNLAPVADVSVSPGDFIYKRTFGRPAAETADYVAAVVAVMREQNMSSALKHFPGYGNNVDTHTGIAVDNRPYQTFTGSDFIPFEKGIAAGAECVLVAHNIVTCIDPGVPASLSKPVHDILRHRLGFTGIILTDDMSMDAILDYADSTHPAVLAVLAGNDMLLLDEVDSAYHAVLAAFNSGEIPADTIDHAVFRILSWKLARGILQT